jgi:light-regulated signal transduction histidine kinase (bacteriophytochrome)
MSITDITLDAAGETAPLPLSDLSLCDKEPITRLERIQSFGFFLAMSRDWRVIRASDNLAQFLGVIPGDALDKSLDALVDFDALHEIRNRLHGLAASGAVERIYGLKMAAHRPALDLAIHYVGATCVIEGELAGLNNRLDAASHVRKMVSKLSEQPTQAAFEAEIARQVRLLTGFDRVMVYRFAASGAGEVVAEALKQGMEPFMGLHYPASDIPVQARALYLRNAFRIIADVEAQTSMLMSTGEVATRPLDLSLSMTRAVSPIHIEYLRNMGVRASLSISIIVEGTLWGLIACHNETPKLPSFVIRSAAELFGLMVSMTLESRFRLLALEYQRKAADLISRLVASVAKNSRLLSDAGWLLAASNEIIAADGLGVYREGAISTAGTTPPVEQIERAARMLDALPPREIFATSNFAALHVTGTGNVSDVAGVLSVPIGRGIGERVLFFRQEQLRDIHWGGDPRERRTLAKDDPRQLSPRHSFAAFAETVCGESAPFSLDEQRSAEAIRAGLVEAILHGSLDAAAEQAREGSRQELLIAELNHRVRNVLALIRGLISQTQGELGDSASYVKSLSGRVQALARAHDRVTRQNWGPGPFNAIFEDEIAAYVPTQRTRFTIAGPFVFLVPQAYSTLALVVHELVTNSSKYGSLSDSGSVEVSLSVEAGVGLHFRWREQGGPLVEPPSRRGFGSVIIERVIPFDLQGTAEVIYAPTGVDARFVVPERFIASGLESERASVELVTAAATVSASKKSSRILAGKNVILLEDNLIVAIEAEGFLKALGAGSIQTVSSVAAANALLLKSRPGFAVLDINLGFETSFAFSAALRSAGIPFIFTSGYGEGRAPGMAAIGEKIVSKPYDQDSLAAAITSTLAR